MASPAKQRRTSTETRRRILDAARDLAVDQGFSGFTVEKVAERAGVSRLTVYYQFGSKPDLLESLLDHIAERGRVERLKGAFLEADPVAALDRFIDVFCGFWASDPVGIRRLRGWEASEPAAGELAHDRDAWRRRGVKRLVDRIAGAREGPMAMQLSDAVDVLYALTSFESYDGLSRVGHGEAEIAALLKRTARTVLGVE